MLIAFEAYTRWTIQVIYILIRIWMPRVNALVLGSIMELYGTCNRNTGKGTCYEWTATAIWLEQQK